MINSPAPTAAMSFAGKRPVRIGRNSLDFSAPRYDAKPCDQVVSAWPGPCRTATKVASRLLLPLLVAALIGCAHSQAHVDLPSGAGFDEAYLTWLVHYHEEQDRMTIPCAQNDTIRQELRNFCAQTDQQHAERIERMRTWLKNWYNEDLPRPETLPLWLASLKGEEFEREFFKEYLNEHDEGIEQTAKCAAKAVHPELRGLCARINPLQKKTGAQLRQWRCEWFKDCS